MFLRVCHATVGLLWHRVQLLLHFKFTNCKLTNVK
jgi:hypothetical protein